MPLFVVLDVEQGQNYADDLTIAVRRIQLNPWTRRDQRRYSTVWEYLSRSPAIHPNNVLTRFQVVASGATVYLMIFFEQLPLVPERRRPQLRL